MDHNKVIERIRSGSEEELAVVYKKYRKEFINWITRTYNCSIEDSKDLYQTTIIIFYESIISGKLVELKSSLKTYLFAIGKNKVHEHKRYLVKKEALITDSTDNFNLSEELPEEEERNFKKVEWCLEKLGDPCKTMLQLYYYGQLSITELTKKLNYKNTDTSKNLKHKCLKRLRKIYESQPENSK